LHDRSRAGLGIRVIRGKDPLPLVLVEPAEAVHLEAVLLQQGRGTRGPSPAVSGGENRTVSGKLIESAV
jgi:hypothetical protein